jgi:GR25 family glycosyltransferase involved in LPS biosynthesis
MKGQIVYVKGHTDSEKQAQVSLDSFLKYGWEVELVEGITPKTLDESEFDYPNQKDGRLDAFQSQNSPAYKIKKSCLFNHLRFFQRVIEQNTPMAFLEHDTVCQSAWTDPTFDELLILNLDHAFKPPTTFGDKPGFSNWQPPYSMTAVNDLPSDYPLKYYKNNQYKGHNMIAGTAAYIISPKGAKKLLNALSQGLDQSDFFINSRNVRLQYLSPSPVRFQKVNLNTSHKL